MVSILITGSADGLGQLAAKALVDQGYQIVLHARSAERARHAIQNAPDAAHVLVGDLSDIDEIKQVAAAARARGVHRQRSGTLSAHLPDTETAAADLPEFRYASAGTRESGAARQ